MHVLTSNCKMSMPPYAGEPPRLHKKEVTFYILEHILNFVCNLRHLVILCHFLFLLYLFSQKYLFN